MAASSAAAADGFARSLGTTSVARLIAAHDWSTTDLGGVATWPVQLRTAVAMVARSPVSMALLWGPGGTMIYNEGYSAIVGDKHPGSLGMSALAVWPEAADFNADVILRVLSGESLSFRDQRFALQRNGRLEDTWFDLDYSPVCDAAGAPVGVIAVVVETTRSVQAAERLDAERARFHELFEQAPTFMAVLRGAKHRIELANPGYFQLVGHRDVLGKTVAEALPDAAAQGYLQLLDDVFDSGVPVSRDGAKYTVQAQPNGAVSERYVDFAYQPIRDPWGKVSGIFVQGVDVTDRVRAERAVRQAETLNRQILDSAVDFAIISFDLAGKVTRWNEGAHRVLGWSQAEMLGQDGSRFFTPEDRAAGRLELEMRCALAEGVGNDERWHLRKSGERFWANGEMTPLRDDSGEPVGFVKVLRDRTEQHKAAESLRESDERLHRAQDVGGVGTFTLDTDTNLIFGTRQFYRIFGLPEAESLPAQDFETLVLPEDVAVRSAAATRRDESASLDVEYRIRRRDDGALRWISRKAKFERDDQGVVRRMVGVVQDVTERKAALQAVEDSANQFRTFAESLPNHVWTAQPDGQLDWFNERVYQYSGAAPGELDGSLWGAILHPDDLPAAAEQWSASIASGANYETEFRIRRHDGAMRWHLVRALPLRTKDGISRWIGTNTDIHERKLAEAESTRDRDRIWTLSQELMLVCDFQGVISAVNPAAGRILGWDPAQMVGQTLGSFLHPEDVVGTASEVGKLAHGQTTLAFENRYRRIDGTYRLLNWTAVPDGGFIHAVARDITRERATEEALRQSQKLEAIGQLTGGVAHDFNNVLAVIRTSIDLLRRVQLSDERRVRFMEAISNAVTRATKLTGQLLAFARRQALQPVVFDACLNTQAVSEMIASLTGVRIDIELELSDQPCFIHADPSQFDTALVNLAVNARDAMEGSGKLRIAVKAVDAIPGPAGGQAGQFVAISIGDTGSGIAPEHLTQIFEPFFTTKGAGQGTGLGLSQVFGFAKQSGGDIQVESQIGVGTTFTLYLLRTARPGVGVDVVATQGTLALGGGACVLVVEDNPEVAASVEQTLVELGYRTVIAPSAESALTELQTDPARFVAVFSDVVMSGMNGIDLGNEIRRRHPTLPVVLSSGYSYVLAQSPDHGFVLLPKPYSLEELAQVLDDTIKKHRAPASAPWRRSQVFLQAAGPQRAEVSEAARLAELDSLAVMDTEAEAAYDELTRLAAAYFKAPIALISLVDDKRQWFKSRVGLDAAETPRELAFCAHAIRNPDTVLVVPDAFEDARFAQNPLVTGDPNIRFYAGAPLVTSTGQPLGTLCVIDTEPREMDASQFETLQFLASQVIQRLEARRDESRPPIAAVPGSK